MLSKDHHHSTGYTFSVLGVLFNVYFTSFSTSYKKYKIRSSFSFFFRHKNDSFKSFKDSEDKSVAQFSDAILFKYLIKCFLT